MANFLEVIKKANFCVIKIANFFYKNVEFLLWKWRISISGFSQNGEFFALVIECLISLHWKKWTFWRNWKTFTLLVHFRWQWCWWQNHYVGDFFRYVGDFSNVSNRSPTSWIGHQHLKLVTNTFGLQHPSPTSM